MGPKLLEKVVIELKDRIKGGIISKIHQPEERVLILKIFTRGREERLLISAEQKFSTVHLIGPEVGFINPPVPKRFCAYLRSRIINSLVEDVTQVAGERIARIALRKRLDSSTESFTLVSELTGKSANIILLDEKGAVLDALRHFPPESVRIVMPGFPLAPLPPARAVKSEEDQLLIPKAVGSWNEAVSRYYSTLLGEDELISFRANLKRAINEARKKALRKLENLLGDKKRAESDLDYSRLGELLVANLKEIKRGAREAAVKDYTKTPPEAVIVPLDGKLGPRENVEKYFKRAKKARVALSLLKDSIPRVKDDLEYIDSLIYEWEAAKTMEDLSALEEELRGQNYLKQEAVRAGKAPPKAEPIRRFISSEGFEILCGKSGPGNDLILRKYAKEEDIWFHALNVPGSHALVKSAGRVKELTDKTIREAAQIAAWYSKNQGAAKAEVIYSEAKNVKKPRGAKPGAVTVKEYKTIVVAPAFREEKS